jgi:hypothetical protein
MTFSTPRVITAAAAAVILCYSAVSAEWVVSFEDDFVGTNLNASTWNVANNFTHGAGTLHMGMRHPDATEPPTAISSYGCANWK